jgi:phage gpG-like protein
LEKVFPRVIGVESVKIIKANFQAQGYKATSAGTKKWKKRSPTTDEIYDYNRTSSYRTPKLGKKSKHRNPYKGSVVNSKNPILKQTGNLRDSVTYKVNGNVIEIGLWTKPVTIAGKTVDTIVYGKINNEGGTVMMFGKHTVHIPQRQFMPTPRQGPNRQMLDIYKKKYSQQLNKIMGQWKS